jgi:hypothetical protein
VVYVWKPDDSESFLDGGRSYRLHLPPSVEPGVFWSVAVCEAAGASRAPGAVTAPGLCAYNSTPNADGSVDVYFGPSAPSGRERNWIRTVKGRRWFPHFRFYSPLEPLEETWSPGDIVEIG